MIIIKKIIVLLTVLYFSTAWGLDASSNSLDARKKARLESTVVNPNIPLEKRIHAIKELHSDIFVDGHIKRTFCAWDPIGKSGPIAATVNDQVLRSLHYGLNLSVIVFQNENELIENFLTEKTCDAILVRGALVAQFNKFSATIEAVGALPESKHLQLLTQVLADPKMGKSLTNDQYTVMGMATVGGSYVFVNDRSDTTLTSLKQKKIGVDSSNLGTETIVNAVGATPIKGALMESVQSYVDGKVDAMISPALPYIVAGNSQDSGNKGAFANSISQSTLQLIGRTELFPLGIAQILREDFLFKFDTYSQRFMQELNGVVSEDFWIPMSEAETKKQNKIYQDIRIKLRDEGYYDASMLRLARKIRCRFEPANSECTNSVE